MICISFIDPRNCLLFKDIKMCKINSITKDHCIGVGDGGGLGGMCPLKFGRKKFFGQLLCKIRAFFGQKSCKIREFCKFSGKSHVKLGHFADF